MQYLVSRGVQPSRGFANEAVRARLDSENDRATAASARRLCTMIVIGLSLVCLAFSVWAVSVGWNNSIFDNHGFRQSQTAISTYYFSYNKFFNYETPVLGPPWSIPFELPVYQAIVFAASKLLHLPLDQAGRLISVIFFYASFVPLFVILRRLGISSLATAPSLAIFAISPQYVFWSRTFMIESTALFFAATYLAFVALAATGETHAGTRGRLLALGIALSGTLGALIKVTTFASFLFAAMLLILQKFWKDWRASKVQAAPLGLLVISAFVMPVAFTYGWTAHADGLKSRNALGFFLTSHALSQWNFGTIAQRLSWSSYAQFAGIGIGQAVANLVGNPISIWLSMALAVGLSARVLRLFLVCISLYISAIAIFFNLHFIHTYYAYANGIFLIAALGISISAALDAGGQRSWAAVCIFVFVSGACATRYFDAYYELQKTNAPGRPVAASVIDRETNSTDALLIYGLEWSSELPYQAQRRAIMVPTWNDSVGPAAQRTISDLGVSHVSALVVCDGARGQSAALLTNMSSIGFAATRRFSADRCDIFLR